MNLEDIKLGQEVEVLEDIEVYGEYVPTTGLRGTVVSFLEPLTQEEYGEHVLVELIGISEQFKDFLHDGNGVAITPQDSENCLWIPLDQLKLV